MFARNSVTWTGGWKNENKDVVKKLRQFLQETTSNSFLNEPAERSNLLWIITSTIFEKYPTNPNEFDDCLKQYLNDHTKMYKDNKSKLSSLGLLFWLYWCYTFS